MLNLRKRVILLFSALTLGTTGTACGVVNPNHEQPKGTLSFVVQFPDIEESNSFSTQAIPAETVKFHIQISGTGLNQQKLDTISLENGKLQTYKANRLPIGLKKVTVIASDGQKHLSAQSTEVNIQPGQTTRAVLELESILQSLTLELKNKVNEQTMVQVNVAGAGFEKGYEMNKVLTFKPGQESLQLEGIPMGSKNIEVKLVGSNPTTLVNKTVLINSQLNQLQLSLPEIERLPEIEDIQPLTESIKAQPEVIKLDPEVITEVQVEQHDVTKALQDKLLTLEGQLNAGSSHQVMINNGFENKALNIKTGDQISWSNSASQPLTLINRENLFPNQVLASGHSFKHYFAEKGTYKFKLKEANDLMIVKVN